MKLNRFLSIGTSAPFDELTYTFDGGGQASVFALGAETILRLSDGTNHSSIAIGNSIVNVIVAQVTQSSVDTYLGCIGQLLKISFDFDTGTFIKTNLPMPGSGSASISDLTFNGGHLRVTAQDDRQFLQFEIATGQ